MDITENTLVNRDKLIITCAITGGIHGKEVNENLPVTPKEQIQAAYEVYNAGASICHLHVRDKQGRATADVNVLGEVVSGINAKCPGMITQLGIGVGTQWWRPPDFHPSDEERMGLTDVIPKPDMITVVAGTTNFNFMRDGRIQTSTMHNKIDFLEEQLRRMDQRGIDASFEIGHLAWLDQAMDFVRRGLWKRTLRFEYMAGLRGTFGCDPRDFLHFVQRLPENCTWSVLAIGPYETSFISLGMVLGGGIRVGMEDNVYYKKGERLKSNVQLVERAVRIARELERDIASVEEARQIMKLGMSS